MAIARQKSFLRWAIGLAAFADASAATLRVPSEYPTINAGLDAAAPGDTVLVAPGTYSDFETRDSGLGLVSACAFLKDGVVLRSEAGPLLTSLDRQGAVSPATDRTIYARGLASPATSVEGFRITGNPPEATAVRIQEFPAPGAVTFRNCVFEDLESTGTGVGALHALGANAAVSDCVFRNCHGLSIGALGQGEAHLTVENCLFENCSPTALRCEGDSFVAETLVVRNSVFRKTRRHLREGQSSRTTTTVGW